MRALAVAAVALLSALVLSGCMTSDPPHRGPPQPQHEPDWAVRAIFLDEDPDATDRLPDHDHAARGNHSGLSTPNMEVLGYTEITSPYFGSSAGSHFCGDVSAPVMRQIAIVHSHLSDVAFSVVDVSDRSAPRFLGELVLPLVFTYDVSIFPDARYAVVAANPDLTLDQAPSGGGAVPFRPVFRDACGGEREVNSTVDYIPYGYSTILVDLEDPTQPRVADFYPYANGRNVHSISTAVVDGTRFVATSGLQAVPCTVPNIPGSPLPPVPCQPVPRYGNLLSHYDFLTVDETSGDARLVPYSVYVPDGTREFDPDLLSLHNGHTDATIQKHPRTNETLAYLANWDGGFLIVRLGDRGEPAELLSRWGEADPTAGGDPSNMSGNIHTAKPVEGLRNGRHLTITGQEVAGRPAGRPTGQVVLLDTTNPTQPVPVARWTIPVNFTWPPAWGLRFSTHYAVLVDDVLFVATYHGGVWAADARESQWPELPSLGVFIPDREPTIPPKVASDTPEVLEVLDLGDGKIAAFDADTGAYVVRFARDHPDVPPAMPWTEDAWIGT